jgi:hypothetical protein
MRSNDRNIRMKERRVGYRKKGQTGNRLCQQHCHDERGKASTAYQVRNYPKIGGAGEK